MAAGMGADVDIGEGPLHALLFGEDQSRYVVAIDPANANLIPLNAEGAGVPFRRLGMAGGSALRFGPHATLAVDDLVRAHEGWFPAFMSDELATSN